MDEEPATGFWTLLGIALRSHSGIRKKGLTEGGAKPTLTNNCCNSSVAGGVCTTVLLPDGAWLATVRRRSLGSSWHGRIPNVVGIELPFRKYKLRSVNNSLLCLRGPDLRDPT